MAKLDTGHEIARMILTKEARDDSNLSAVLSAKANHLSGKLMRARTRMDRHPQSTVLQKVKRRSLDFAPSATTSCAQLPVDQPVFAP